MATNTYVALFKTTVTSNTTAVTFDVSSVTGYQDLVIVSSTQQTIDGEDLSIQFNNDTGANYTHTYLCGGNGGSGPHSAAVGSYSYIPIDHHGTPPTTGTFATSTINIQSYKSTSFFKTILARAGSMSTVAGTVLKVGTWRSASAITSIKLYCTTSSNIVAGSTFSVYGIAAEGVSPAAKATGGSIYSDSTYYYHVFGASGTFTPLQSLTCDYLVVAGGGGGSFYNGGGGGAGGLRSTVGATGGGGSLESPLSLTAQGYTVTVGAGGIKGLYSGLTNATSGSNSTFSTITSTGGGRAGSTYGAPTGGNGGSGGGGGNGGDTSASGGTGTTNQGYAGGSKSGPNDAGAGGGGAGAVGQSRTNASDGAGGAGVAITGFATATGTGVGGYYAGGGGGGFANAGGIASAGGAGGGGNGGCNTGSISPTSGAANTGGGGGGTGLSGGDGGAGGSGLVIVRYAK